jgi:hypothetical protein
LPKKVRFVFLQSVSDSALSLSLDPRSHKTFVVSQTIPQGGVVLHIPPYLCVIPETIGDLRLRADVTEAIKNETLDIIGRI